MIITNIHSFTGKKYTCIELRYASVSVRFGMVFPWNIKLKNINIKKWLYCKYFNWDSEYIIEVRFFFLAFAIRYCK